MIKERAKTGGVLLKNHERRAPCRSRLTSSDKETEKGNDPPNAQIPRDSSDIVVTLAGRVIVLWRDARRQLAAHG